MPCVGFPVKFQYACSNHEHAYQCVLWPASAKRVLLPSACLLQQSSPVPKRRRGAQSPVLGGLQHHLQSPSLAPHPGALGPSFTGECALLAIVLCAMCGSLY